ncbi:ATP-dependent helicase HrpB [Cutibacterium namnetense]|uniref:ATP-dependent helicase HrpB n=1 Tax=[Propionibacterium] namnetense SK182B-JCVI TaxID=1051006 RepID=F9NY64_9ACTN|nr:ATP-dependent helicase HrpB [Cutibacterium namnetense]EGR94392.1 ATP-dependent helicase HrpB [ [[Propionibacterium] namnetense SK182B-JCVI]
MGDRSVTRNSGPDLARVGAGLPVAAYRDEITTALQGRRAVIVAPPGTGKTTFVPPLVASRCSGRVIVTQPRRVAARAAARRLATLTGTRPGAFASHTVRGESTTTRDTKVEFVTTGVLLRRLLNDPDLTGVDAVILDEVHERHLDADLVVAMVCEVAQLRDDLSIVAMSATVDSSGWAALLGGDEPAPVIEVASAVHELEVEWAPAAGAAVESRGVSREFLSHLGAVTIDALNRHAEGSALVFVPGAREVDHVVADLRSRLAGMEVVGLSGAMSAREQDHALSDPGSVRRVIVSTAVAESSLTVPGVRLVVDSGLSREPRLDRGRGMTGLVTVRESRASAVQRAGRAARLGPGVAVRCLRAQDWAGMCADPAPEVDHADLLAPLLSLAVWGSPRGEGMALPTPLPQDRVAAAEEELRGLGAVDAEGRIIARGRHLATFPLDPRLARALTDGAASVGSRRCAEITAMLGLDDGQVDLVGQWRQLRSGKHPEATMWRREADRLARLINDIPSTGTTDDAAVATVVSLARPGWIARSRGVGSMSYLLACGTGVDLPRNCPSGLLGQPWLAVARTSRVTDGALIRAAAPLAESAALESGAAMLTSDTTATWDRGKVRGRRVSRLGAIELSSTPVRPDPAQARHAALEAVRARGLDVAGLTKNGESVRRRLAFAHRVLGDPWPDVSDEALLARVEEWLDLDALAAGRGGDATSGLRGLLGWQESARLDEVVPETITVPSGSRIRVDYPEPGSDASPVLAVKLQECFGWTDGPTVCDGRVRVVLHLLSPARRPLAVTDDLASFWTSGYPAVRVENRGRYSKHPWPEDPMTATPTKHTNRALRRD